MFNVIVRTTAKNILKSTNETTFSVLLLQTRVPANNLITAAPTTQVTTIVLSFSLAVVCSAFQDRYCPKLCTLAPHIPSKVCNLLRPSHFATVVVSLLFWPWPFSDSPSSLINDADNVDRVIPKRFLVYLVEICSWRKVVYCVSNVFM